MSDTSTTAQFGSSPETESAPAAVIRLLTKIADLVDNEDACEPLDDAIRYANEALALIRGAAQSPKEWQSIETAPEGVPVWGWQPPQNGLDDCYGTVQLIEQESGAWFTHHDGEETFTPVCWMPANKPSRPSIVSDTSTDREA